MLNGGALETFYRIYFIKKKKLLLYDTSTFTYSSVNKTHPFRAASHNENVKDPGPHNSGIV